MKIPDATLILRSGHRVQLMDGKAPVTIAGTHTTGLCDTGSAVNAIHPARIPPEATSTATQGPVLSTAAEGGKLETRGNLQLPTSIGDDTHHVDYYAVPKLTHDVILGRPALQQMASAIVFNPIEGPKISQGTSPCLAPKGNQPRSDTVPNPVLRHPY
jgi:Retroviral aspartyl protease.